MRTVRLAISAASVVFLIGSAGCNQPGQAPAPVDSIAEQTASPAPARKELIELFPHVSLDAQERTILIEGWVPIAPGGPHRGRVWLEVVVCSRDTKEHETLVVTEARPAHVHAALLLLGLEPGQPGSWGFEADGSYVKQPPTGPTLRVEFLYEREGETVIDDPRMWMIDAKSQQPPIGDWVFAGSLLVGRAGNVYAADEEGTIVGLSTFGTETIAWSEVHSPETAVEEPAFYANEATVPAFRTPVHVRIVADAPGHR